MKIFNTNTQPQKLTIPTVELVDFEEISIHEEKQTDTKTNLRQKRIQFFKKKFQLCY